MPIVPVPVASRRASALALLCSRARGHAPLLLLLVASTALADATVVVELRRPDGTPAQGSVQLTKGEARHRCATDVSGRCTIAGVAGGVYTVSVEQAGKSAPKDKTVVIPPSGEVKLIVNAN